MSKSATTMESVPVNNEREQNLFLSVFSPMDLLSPHFDKLEQSWMLGINYFYISRITISRDLNGNKMETMKWKEKYTKQ